jgi:hypothetical protein
MEGYTTGAALAQRAPKCKTLIVAIRFINSELCFVLSVLVTWLKTNILI